MDQGYIAQYHNDFNFSGYTARASPEMTLQILHSLGLFAIDPLSVPVILIYHGGYEVQLPPILKLFVLFDILGANEC
ncbi:MAG: hypothetical protein WCF90_05980 [Methanomicrobiales archaeon]